MKVIPWKDFFKRVHEPVAYLKIVPDPTVRNYNVENLAKAFTNYYEKPITLFKQKRYADSFTFEIFLSKEDVSFFVTCPERLKDSIKNVIESIWNKATVKEAESLPYFDSQKCSCAELQYQKHNLFSINTDERTNAPMPGIFSVTKDFQESEQALIQVVCDPINQLQWQYDAKQAYEKFRKGKMPKRNWSGLSVGRLLASVLLGAFSIVDEVLSEFTMSEKDFNARKKRSETTWDSEVMMLMRKGLSEASKKKPNSDCLRTWIRIVCQSDDLNRRNLHMKRIAGSYREIDGENQLERKDVKEKWIGKFLDDMQNRRSPAYKHTANIMSVSEIGKLQQLPTADLQKEYEQIDSINKPEISLPDELFLDVKGIVVGKVTEKGTTRTARIPLESYKGRELKYVYDAYCLPEFCFGEQGSGKTGEAIHRAHSAICLGQTVFFFDTADGNAVRELHDSLPADYPEDKIVHIDLTNKARPIPLTWAFQPKRTKADSELEAEIARETAKSFLRQYVEGMATSSFTDRMDRYLSSVSRAAGSSPLDIELGLTSPSYREELMNKRTVQESPDIMIELENLQDKALRGSDDISVDGIMSRLRKLSSDTFRSNLFYQKTRNPLNFRHYADNLKGGYGYCVTIYCDKNSFGPDGQEAILTYLFAKVLLEGAYSRVDIDPGDRKPFVVILDEPHRFIKGEMATKLGQDAAVELRKYRCKLVFMNHGFDQLGELWETLQSGGVQVTMYKSKNLKAFKDLATIIAPLDPEQAWASLGEHEAVVTRRLPSKHDVVFICKMAPPPKRVKDRSDRRIACAQQFGRNWKEVRNEIQAKRTEYALKDRAWLLKKFLAIEAQKEAAKQAAKESKQKEKKKA